MKNNKMVKPTFVNSVKKSTKNKVRSAFEDSTNIAIDAISIID